MTLHNEKLALLTAPVRFSIMNTVVKDNKSSEPDHA